MTWRTWRSVDRALTSFALLVIVVSAVRLGSVLPNFVELLRFMGSSTLVVSLVATHRYRLRMAAALLLFGSASIAAFWIVVVDVGHLRMISFLAAVGWLIMNGRELATARTKPVATDEVFEIDRGSGGFAMFDVWRKRNLLSRLLDNDSFDGATLIFAEAFYLYERGHCVRARNRMAALSKRAERDGAWVAVLRLRARVSYCLVKLHLARELYDDVVRLTNSTDDTLALIACNVAIGDFSRANTLLEHTARTPAEPMQHFMNALVKEAVRENSYAKRLYEEHILLWGPSCRVLCRLATLALAEGDSRAALDALARCSETAGRTTPQIEAAKAYARSDQTEEPPRLLRRPDQWTMCDRLNLASEWAR